MSNPKTGSVSIKSVLLNASIASSVITLEKINPAIVAKAREEVLAFLYYLQQKIFLILFLLIML